MNTDLHPTLVILVGPPGSGKTHIAERFAVRHRFVHINSDSVRAKYFPNPQFTTEERKQVCKKIQEVITALLTEGSNDFFDGNLLTNAARFETLEYYQKLNSKVLFVYVDVPREVAIKRALARHSSKDGLYNEMPKERAVRMHDTFELLDIKLPQVRVANIGDYGQLERQILDALQVVV